jgi:hypothetical protein
MKLISTTTLALLALMLLHSSLEVNLTPHMRITFKNC